MAAFEAWGSWAREALEHLRELARDAVGLGREVVGTVRELVAGKVADIADLFAGLGRVDTRDLDEARQALRQHEERHERQHARERAIDQAVERELLRSQERQAQRERQRDRGMGLEL